MWAGCIGNIPHVLRLVDGTPATWCTGNTKNLLGKKSVANDIKPINNMINKKHIKVLFK